MSGVDTQALRDALKPPAGLAADPGEPVDVAQIMAKGRRLRRRRRLATVAGGLGAVAVLAGSATVIANLTAAPPDRVVPAGPAQHAPARPAASASSGASLPSVRRSGRGTVRQTPTPSASRTPSASTTPQRAVPSPASSLVTWPAAVASPGTQAALRAPGPGPSLSLVIFPPRFISALLRVRLEARGPAGD